MDEIDALRPGRYHNHSMGYTIHLYQNETGEWVHCVDGDTHHYATNQTVMLPWINSDDVHRIGDTNYGRNRRILPQEKEAPQGDTHPA